MSRSETRVVLADTALQLEALAEQLSGSSLPRPFSLATPAAASRSVSSLAHDAVAEVLSEMGLTVQRTTDSAGRTILTGRSVMPGRQQARVATVAVGDDGCVHTVIDDVADAVHDLDEHADEICATAVRDSNDFHARLSRSALRRGLRPGPVEELGLPTRGGGGAAAVAVPRAAAVRRARR